MLPVPADWSLAFFRRATYVFSTALRIASGGFLRVLTAAATSMPRLCAIPSIGPIRAAILLGIVQTTRRFRTKRQLWTYSGLGIEMHSSDDHHVVKALVFMIVLWIVRRGPSTSCHQIARALSSVSPLVLLLPR